MKETKIINVVRNILIELTAGLFFLCSALTEIDSVNLQNMRELNAGN